MSINTKNLDLFKWNVQTDGEEEFDIDKSLNENWDKLESIISNGFIKISGLATYKSWNATTHSGSIEIAGDYSTYLKPGTKLKLVQGTDKYFYVKSSTYASNKTTVEFWCPTSATTLVNSAITYAYFGVEPQGFANEVVNADW